MATYSDELLGDTAVYPERGNVCFTAGLHNWSFTLGTFSKMYAAKFGVSKDKMMERLWGDNFFDPATKSWTTKVRQPASHPLTPCLVSCLVQLAA